MLPDSESDTRYLRAIIKHGWSASPAHCAWFQATSVYGSRRDLLLCIVVMKMEEGVHMTILFVIDDYYFPRCVKFMNEALWCLG